MTLNPREQFCFDTATHFSAVRGRIAAGTRIRREFLQLHQAEAWALNQFKGDGRTMLYAVSDQGSAHIRNI